MSTTEPHQSLWTRSFTQVTLISFLIFMNHIMVLTTFPFYVETLGGTELIAGLAAALFSVVALFSRPFIGGVLDNGKRRAILIAGIIGMALMPLGYLAASILALAFVFRMLHGAFLECASTASGTIATDLIPKARFGEGMGMFSTSIALSTCFAPALGLFLMNRFGFGALYGTAAGMLVVAFALYLMMDMPKVEVEIKPLRVKELIAADALPASAVILFFLLSFGAVENFIAKFAASMPELPSGGVFFALMSIVLVLTRILLSKVIDRHGEAFFVYSGNFAMLVASLLLAYHPTTVTFVIAAVLVGYGFGGMQPAAHYGHARRANGTARRRELDVLMHLRHWHWNRWGYCRLAHLRTRIRRDVRRHGRFSACITGGLLVLGTQASFRVRQPYEAKNKPDLDASFRGN